MLLFADASADFVVDDEGDADFEHDDDDDDRGGYPCGASGCSTGVAHRGRSAWKSARVAVRLTDEELPMAEVQFGNAKGSARCQFAELPWIPRATIHSFTTVRVDANKTEERASTRPTYRC
jgi:hypothetical protein